MNSNFLRDFLIGGITENISKTLTAPLKIVNFFYKLKIQIFN